MVKITSRWFSYAQYGTVMGIVSLSFLFGDALARTFMGLLIGAHLSWRGVFIVTATVLGVLWTLNHLVIHESPVDLGLPEPETNPDNLFGELGQDPHPEAAGPLWATLGKSPAFWIVCCISLGVTLLRETFNNWTPTYLVEVVGLGEARAATMSSLFQFFGGISVIAAGMLGDRFGRGVRGNHSYWHVALWQEAARRLLETTNFGAARPAEALALVSSVAFLLIGPYSYLAGAIALDFGGKRGGATACGIIDGVGYLFGGVIAGKVIANLSVSLGWQGVFRILAVVALLTSIAAAFFLSKQLRPTRLVQVPLVLENGDNGKLNAKRMRYIAMKIDDDAHTLFSSMHARAYQRPEAVSQTEHALQAAELAEREGAPDHLVVAALLHDVGHLLDGQDEDLANRGLDGRHEEAGYAWLAKHFGARVTEPIRLHVAAKRYLCAVDPTYLADLSPASRMSLALQGGPMDVSEPC